MNAPAVTTNHLNIGDMLLGSAPHRLSTLLGSCVAITMYDPSRKIGSMCHCALPRCRSAHKCQPSCNQSGKHVECAVRVMLSYFRKQQISKKNIQLKIFGGANMFTLIDKNSATWLVGSKNVETARQIITRNGLSIRASDTGGKRGRKILFDISTGKVSVSRVKKIPLLQQKQQDFPIWV